MESITQELSMYSSKQNSYDTRLNCEGNAVIFSILAKKDNPKTDIKIWGIKTDNGYHVYVERDGEILNKGVTSAMDENPEDINTYYPDFSKQDILKMADNGQACDETQKLMTAFLRDGKYKEKSGLTRNINKPMIEKILSERLKTEN